MKKISIKNIYLILVISIGLIILGIGSTYAMFTASGNIDNPISLSSNLTYSDDVFESFDITLSSKESRIIKFNVNNNTNISSIKYTSWYIYDGTDTDLTFYTIKVDSSDIEPSGTLSSSGTINIKIVNNTSSKVSLTVGVSSSKDSIVLPEYMKLISVNEEPLATYISNLYTNATKSTVTNNSITYNYATEESLMNDRLGSSSTDINGGNIRYYGASPNNYIYFNCDSYPSTNCETWRIIGIFDGKVKIVRNENIGSYSWNTSSNINEWTSSRLMKLLNPGYDSETAGGSLYYNSGSGKCYTSSASTSACDFTSTGIKNDKTREMIAPVTWNLGGYSSYSVYSNQIYGYERGTTVYSGRSTTWENGKIAIPYPSDYGYATDFNKCSQNLYNYDSSTSSYACRSNDWLYSILTNSGSSYGWFLTPSSSVSNNAWRIYSSGYLNYNGTVYTSHYVTPTLYLDSEVKYIDGTGESSSPYQIYLASSSSDTEDSYSLTLSKDTRVSAIYYKTSDANSYTSSTSDVSLNVASGTVVYYYGTASSGYTMDSCTESSPCSTTVTSSTSKTLSASTTYYTLSITKISGVSTIYFKPSTASSYTSSTSDVSLKVASGTVVYYYGTASSGYTMNSCTESSPCSVTLTSDTSKYLTASASASTTYYNLSITKGSGVSTIYYKKSSASSYTSSSSSVSLSVASGTTFYYYGTASSGYTMNSCTSSSPCSTTVTSDISKTLSASASSSTTYYTFNLSMGTGVSAIYYKTSSSSSYSSRTSDLNLSVPSGTTVYYYGTASSGYTMNSCTSSSPCSTTVTSSTSKTLSASASTSYYTLSITKGSGVSTIYYKSSTASSYTSSSSSVSLSVADGSTYSYYGVASSGFTVSSCTSSSPCSVTISGSGKSVKVGVYSYYVMIKKGTGVSTIYYRAGSSGSYTSSSSDVTVTAPNGVTTTYYYYGVASSGYSMDSCTSSSPCTVVGGTSHVTRTLSATALTTYTVQIKKSVDGGSATSVTSNSVVSGGSWTTTVSGGNYYYIDSVSCTNGQTATVSEVLNGSTQVVNASFTISNVTSNTVCTIKMTS